jgi:polyisoprenyl-phosphate glycosyltransferase
VANSSANQEWPPAGIGNPTLSIVVPVLNESEGLYELHRRLVAVLDAKEFDAEILFVNDGSTDDSIDIMNYLCEIDARVGVVDLSRRFGKEIAMSAGLDHASGDAVILIDADLQDPPEYIPDMVAAWRQGHDVVAMQRADRSVDSLFKRLSARLFYRLLNGLSPVEIPPGVGDFRLLSRRAVDALTRLRERNRYMKGLYAWVGFSYIELPYRREARHAGNSKWPFAKLLGLAIDGITSFTIAPLRIASFIGLVTALGAFIYGVVIIVKTLLYGEPVAGFPALMVTITFLGSVQLLSIGLLGEYVGRMFVETKRRPMYLLRSAALPQQARQSGAPSAKVHALGS